MEQTETKYGFKSYYLRIPIKLYNALTEQAEKDRRSLAQEIIFLLEKSIQPPVSQ